MKKTIRFLLMGMLAIGLLMTGCSSNGEEAPSEQPEQTAGAEVHVFAAASLTDCLNEIITNYEEESTNRIIPVYEASGTLRQQIEAGADCDLFISANQKHMDTLEEAGAIVVDSRRDLLGNALTLIVSAEKADLITGVEGLAGDAIAVIAIGEPTEVPAGQYAQELLENLGLWEEVQDKLVFGKNVRSVLTYVDGGDADCGFVYHTDALELESGKIVCDAPEDQYTAVYYPSAILTEAPQPEAAADFYGYLATDSAKAVFEQYGFTTL